MHLHCARDKVCAYIRLGAYMTINLENLREILQDNLLVVFDHLTDEEKSAMCQVVVDTVQLLVNHNPQTASLPSLR